MAHEALKFNVILNDFENWQPIVGSEDYGTFYIIYIKFDKVVEKEDGIYYICDFKLQNYKGAISIGLATSPTIRMLTDENKRDNETIIKDKIPKFNKKSKEQQAEILKMHNIDCILEIGTKPFDLTEEIHNIPLGPLEKPLNGLVLETDCQRQNPDDKFSKTLNPLKSIYLNPYDFERAGDEIIEIGRRNHGSANAFNSLGRGGTLLSNCNPSRSFLR